jgi:beta-glucosidase
MPVAEVLTGKINPSGKLPFTIGRRAEDHSWWGAYLPQGAEIYEEARYGLTPSNTAWDCVYSEGIYNDYRWFDKNSISPLFAFGHGLSYTVFSYENLNVTVRDDRNVFVEVTIKNTGIRAGKEAVQFYLQDVDASIDRPIKELKGIAKIGLAPGESGKVGILLKPADFSFWHPESRQWVIEAGEFRIFAGSSSRDIRQTCTVHYGAIK